MYMLSALVLPEIPGKSTELPSASVDNRNGFQNWILFYLAVG